MRWPYTTADFQTLIRHQVLTRGRILYHLLLDCKDGDGGNEVNWALSFQTGVTACSGGRCPWAEDF
ncbi:unnamed protein product [Calypogeia fissa]